MSRVKASTGRVAPAGEDLRSEPWIVATLAGAVLGEDDIPWRRFAGDYDAIRDRIAAVVAGFDSMGSRVRDRRGRASRSFTLPHPPRDARRFETPSGRARLTVNPLEPIEVPAGHLLLQTLRSPRPVQHHRLQPRRPLPGDRRAPRRGAS